MSRSFKEQLLEDVEDFLIDGKRNTWQQEVWNVNRDGNVIRWTNRVQLAGTLMRIDILMVLEVKTDFNDVHIKSFFGKTKIKEEILTHNEMRDRIESASCI